MLNCLHQGAVVRIPLPSPSVTSVIKRAINAVRPDLLVLEGSEDTGETTNYLLCHPFKTPGLEDRLEQLYPRAQFVRFYDDNENLGEWSTNCTNSSLAISNFRKPGYEYFPYCQIAFAQAAEPHCVVKRLEFTHDLSYVGAKKPSRMETLALVPQDALTFRSGLSNLEMMALYRDSVASLVLRSPGQETCITSRYFESLLSGRYALFHTNCGAPSELSWHDSDSLMALYRKARANDDSLWQAQLTYLKQLQQWQTLTT